MVVVPETSFTKLPLNRLSSCDVIPVVKKREDAAFGLVAAKV